MKKILTIDFDIMMAPSIDLYNDSDLDVDEFLNKFDFVGILEADLDLYRNLTQIILNNKDKITFIYDHHDIVEYLKDEEEPIELHNIDYHHDLGYGDDMAWHRPLKENEYHEGNWVKYLYDLKKIKSYFWYKHYNSSDPAEEGKKFLNEKHFISGIDPTHFINDIQPDHIYVSLSSPWVPMYYTTLYNVWEDLTNTK